MTTNETRVLSSNYKEERYQTLPLSAEGNTNKPDRHAAPQQCRARMTCGICGTYDDFIYEELSPENGWQKLCGQGIYECMSCSALYTTDDALPENRFASAWLYWTSKEAAISHLSWIEHQLSQANQEIMSTEPSTVYEVASKLTKDGFNDASISVSDGILSVTCLAPFRQFESGKYADAIKTTGFAFKRNEGGGITYSVRLSIASHPYDDGGEPNIPAIQASASQAPALIYLEPKIYSQFLECMQNGPDLLESQLAFASIRIMEQITKANNA